MGKVFLKIKLDNFERVREEKIVYGIDNLRKEMVCSNLFSIVSHELTSGVPTKALYDLNVYDGTDIFKLTATKENFKELFESVDFEGIEIPLVKFNEPLYEMIMDNQDRFFDVISVEHLSGKKITFEEDDFDNGLIGIRKNEDSWDEEEIVVSSLMIDLKGLAKILSEEKSYESEIKEVKKPKIKKETIEKEEVSIGLEKETNEVNQTKKKKTDENILNPFVDMLVMQSMTNLFNQQNKTDDEIKLEKLKNFLKNLN